jgi:hypothetical protein
MPKQRERCLDMKFKKITRYTYLYGLTKKIKNIGCLKMYFGLA